jgi:hypothetical protein
MFEPGKEPENLMRKSLPDEQLRIVARELAYFRVKKKLPNGIISEHLIDQVGSMYWNARKDEQKKKLVNRGTVKVDGEDRDSEIFTLEDDIISLSDVPGLIIEALTQEIIERYAKGR